MSDSPFVSIIIPTYNCPYVGYAIESALLQSYPYKEVIVVNDGSTEYKETIEPYLGRIRYMEKANGGTGSALNLGMKHARGEYLTWLSSDDLYSREKLARQLAFMCSVNADVSYTACYLINEKNKVIGRSGTAYSSKKQFYQAMMQGNVINGCTVMMKKKVLAHVGNFDERLRCTQDYDLWCRILRHYDFYYLDKPLVRYRIHDEMGTKKLGARIERERALIQKRYRRMLRRLIERAGDG